MEDWESQAINAAIEQNHDTLKYIWVDQFKTEQGGYEESKTPYTIDLKEKTQLNETTGTVRKLLRGVP